LARERCAPDGQRRFGAVAALAVDSRLTGAGRARAGDQLRCGCPLDPPPAAPAPVISCAAATRSTRRRPRPRRWAAVPRLAV